MTNGLVSTERISSIVPRSVSALVVMLALGALAVLAPASASATLAFTPSSQNPIPGGKTQGSVATGDFNDDGYDDFAFVAGGVYDNGTWADSGLYVYLSHDGDGTFTQASGSPMFVNGGPAVVRSGRLDGDDETDLLVGFGGAIMKPMFGAGDGTFTEGTDFQMDLSTIGDGNSVLADLDGDHDLDFANSGYIDSYSVALNDGSGVFTTKPVAHTGLDGAYGLEYIAAGDFDGDGEPDLAMSNYPQTFANTQYWGIYAVSGNGDGTFDPVTESAPFTIANGNFAKAIGSGDFDTSTPATPDDLVVTHLGDPGAELLLGNTDDFLVPHAGSQFTTGDFPISPAAADMNRDGNLDVVTGDFGGHSFSVGLGDGSGNLSRDSNSSFSLGDNNFFPSSLGVGDFNGDGAPDVVVTSSSSSPTTTNGVDVMLAAPTITDSPDGFGFGYVDVGQSSTPDTLTVSNPSALDAEIDSVQLGGAQPGQYAISNDQCKNTTLEPGGSCTLKIAFKPTSIGDKEATIEVGGPALATLTTPMIGTGGSAILNPNPATVDLGDVATGDTQTDSVEFTNTGNVNGSVTGASIVGGDAGQFSVNGDGCAGEDLAPGESCSVSVAFSPTSLGAKTATLDLAGPGLPSTTAALEGTGVLPPPSAGLKLKAPKKAKHGKTVKVSYTVKNERDNQLEGVKLAVKASPKKSVKGPKPVSLKPIAGNATAKGKLSLKVSKKAKKNSTLTIRVTATVGGEPLNQAITTTVVK